MITSTAEAQEWDERQRAYWSSLVGAYDSLYESPWSRAENEWVASRLALVNRVPQPRIVDLGCGTGLGAQLVGRWTDLERYVGVDISEGMAAVTAARFGVATHVGSMDDLGWLADNSCDLVIALFSSVSFAASVPDLLSEVVRVLRPGGRAYLSALGRDFSARPSVAAFRTRGRRLRQPSIPAHRFSARRLGEAAQAAGLVDISVTGMNSLAGLLEASVLWGVGEQIAAWWPDSSHLLELTCSKAELQTEEKR